MQQRIFQTTQRQKEVLATRYSLNGEIKKQIDFFIISKKHHNWVNNITNNQLANARQNMRRKMIKIQLRIKLN